MVISNKKVLINSKYKLNLKIVRLTIEKRMNIFLKV